MRAMLPIGVFSSGRNKRHPLFRADGKRHRILVGQAGRLLMAIAVVLVRSMPALSLQRHLAAGHSSISARRSCFRSSCRNSLAMKVADIEVAIEEELEKERQKVKRKARRINDAR